MHVDLLDIALLSVLVLFFGLLQAHRPRRVYRLWLCAWVLILCSLLAYLPRNLPYDWRVMQECVRIDLQLYGGVMFLMSFLERRITRARLNASIVVLGIPPCLLLDLQTAGVGRQWMYVAIILAGQAIAINMTQYLVSNRFVRNILQVFCAVCAVALVLSVDSGRPDLTLTILLVEVFTACGVLLMASGTSARTGRWAAFFGFILWSVLYVVYELYYSFPTVAFALVHIWHLPKYMVGFGMILMVVENDTAEIGVLSEEYRLLYESNPHPMWIFDPVSARFLSVNDAAVQAYGYTRDEFLAMTLFDLRPEEDHERLAERLQDLQPEKQAWRHRRKSGEVFDVEISGHDVAFQGANARFVMAMDITARETLNRELVHGAQHDPLTGLANRILLEERAEQSLVRSMRDGSRTAILTIDVDRFKQVNDTYGHMVGDECLKEIAQRLSTRVRQADTLARTGGEEFTVLVGGLASVRGAQAAAASLLGTLTEPLSLSTNEITVSVSIGIALYPDDGADLETVRKRSDKALYKAKAMGGGRAVLASEEKVGEEHSAVDLESAIRDGLQTDGMSLVYQPIFDSAGKLARVEALVRGKAECLRKAGPAAFIPVAEESGLIVPLGRWVLEEACRQMAEWRARDLPVFELAVNVSARQLVQAHFTEEVLATLDRYGIPPALLHLELTETTLMRDFSAMVRCMKQLSEAGVLFSIDDFGTGYSSLARLSELPISTLKIDRSFVIKLLESETAIGIVRAIVHMSRHLKLEVVAEGVEEPEHIRMLLDLGCHMFQGYYLSRPVTAEDLEVAVGQGSLGFDPEALRLITQPRIVA